MIVLLDVIKHLGIEHGHKLVSKISEHLVHGGIAIIGTPSILLRLSKPTEQSLWSRWIIKLIENYFDRTLPFSMNDELVHTGHPKMAWYYFIIAAYPKKWKKYLFLDLRILNEKERNELLSAIETTLKHGRLINGPEVEKLELEIARRCNRKYAVGVSFLDKRRNY